MMDENVQKKYEVSIENFICDQYSICREERQYVVFLYNILRKYSTPESRKKEDDETIGKVRKIFQSCGLEDNAVVDHVFYEVTFMRDFFERNRRLMLSKESEWPAKLLNKTFTPLTEGSKDSEEAKASESLNTKLIQYVYEQKHKEEDGIKEIEYRGKECNLGQNNNEIDFENLRDKNGKINLDNEDENWIKHMVKWMMNAQPDIAVIYHKKDEKTDKKFLLFIECKFTSRESKYTYNKSKGKESVKQGKVQWMIADFLCTYLKKDDEEIVLSSGMEEDRSRFVYFRTRQTQENGEKKNIILIQDLIECDKKIFST